MAPRVERRVETWLIAASSKLIAASVDVTVLRAEAAVRPSAALEEVGALYRGRLARLRGEPWPQLRPGVARLE